MKCQRRILGIRWHDFVRNSEVSLRTGLAPVSDRIRQRLDPQGQSQGHSIQGQGQDLTSLVCIYVCKEVRRVLGTPTGARPRRRRHRRRRRAACLRRRAPTGRPRPDHRRRVSPTGKSSRPRLTHRGGGVRDRRPPPGCDTWTRSRRAAAAAAAALSRRDDRRPRRPTGSG